MRNHYDFKKLLPILLLALACAGLFAGCHGAQYKEDEKAALEEKGAALMQAWLDEHMKGGEVLSAEADILMYPSGPHYLTDYVAGNLTVGGKERGYYVNTGTGALYLYTDCGLLSDVCLDEAFRILGLNDAQDECVVVDYSASLWLPDTGNGFVNAEHDEAAILMPGELVLSLEEAGEEEQRSLLEDFVRSPGGREPIEFGGVIRVPEETDLERCGMAYWQKLQADYGIKFENFNLYDGFENIATYSDRAAYDRYCFREVEEPDIRIFMTEAYWVEKAGKDGIKVDEKKEYDFSDLKFEKTDEGYLVTFPDYDHVFGFMIYADEGSEFRKHEYHNHEDREAYLSPGSTISGDRYFEYDLYWKDAGEDGYLLTNEDGVAEWFYGGEELIPRE